METEDAHNFSDFFGKQVIFKQSPILDFKKSLEKFNNVTSEDIIKVCNKYFRKDLLNIATIGNYRKSEIKAFIENYSF